MPIKAEYRPAFERRRKQHGIIFTDAIPPERWPENHRGVFESIEKLKQFKYSTYATAQESGDEFDWKHTAKKHARRLREKAKDCVSRNEATWRFACEPLVFSRLTSEIACKNCRKRIWRSEVEAKLDGETRAASKLRKRQENRDPCRCPRNTRPNDEDERIGLNKLFIDRAEDKVVHPRDLAKQLPQEQRPDRVFGLRQTRNFEDLMFKELGSGEFLAESLQQQPHPALLGEALLFPFLVIEAKAGNAPDDWSSIRLQTAFPIYTYLNVQQNLRSATAQGSKWAAGPLVWFFMSRGDDWRLSLAYNRPGIGQPSPASPHHTTEIVQVWTGCITNRDDALQLFLIVDYMSDWARDVYRPALLTELRILASSDADLATVFTDTDIYSSRDLLLPQNVETSQSGHHEMQAAFRSLDSRLGTIRHIAPIETRFLSLFITGDSIQTFLRSMGKKIREYFVRRVLDQFHSTQTPCLLSIDQLNSMEEVWTGQSQPRAPFNLKQTKFYTIHLVSYLMSASWEQVRELCVISIAEDAFETLIAESNLKINHGKARIPSAVIQGDDFQSNDTLTDRLSRLRRSCANRNLLASISRTAGYIDASPSATWPWFKPGDALIWELVHNTYKFHKKGELEPELPFLRLSKSYETQEIDRDGCNTPKSDVSTSSNRSSEGSINFDETISYSSAKTVDGWGYQCDADSDDSDSCSNHRHPIPPLYGELQVSDAGAILVHGRVNYSAEGRSPSNICVYLVHDTLEPPSTDDLARIIKGTFEDCDVYHTTRDNGNLNLRADKRYRNIWNLRKPYGVFFSYGGSSFVKWLEGLNGPLPTRQGSRRGPLDTGRSIFDREYSPWHDPRLLYGGPYGDQKKRFLKLLLTAELTAWASVAKEKISRGVDCCALCARENIRLLTDTDYETDYDDDDYEEFYYEVGLCDDCQESLDTYNGYGWDPWVKKMLKKVLVEIRFGAVTNQTSGYQISTPPLRLLSSSPESPGSSNITVHPYESESAVDETTDHSAQHHPTAESLRFQDTSSHMDINANSVIGQNHRGATTPAGGNVATKKRKRSLVAEDSGGPS